MGDTSRGDGGTIMFVNEDTKRSHRGILRGNDCCLADERGRVLSLIATRFSSIVLILGVNDLVNFRRVSMCGSGVNSVLVT